MQFSGSAQKFFPVPKSKKIIYAHSSGGSVAKAYINLGKVVLVCSLVDCCFGLTYQSDLKASVMAGIQTLVKVEADKPQCR